MTTEETFAYIVIFEQTPLCFKTILRELICEGRYVIDSSHQLSICLQEPIEGYIRKISSDHHGYRKHKAKLIGEAPDVELFLKYLKEELECTYHILSKMKSERLTFEFSHLESGTAVHSPASSGGKAEHSLSHAFKPYYTEEDHNDRINQKMENAKHRLENLCKKKEVSKHVLKKYNATKAPISRSEEIQTEDDSSNYQQEEEPRSYISDEEKTDLVGKRVMKLFGANKIPKDSLVQFLRMPQDTIKKLYFGIDEEDSSFIALLAILSDNKLASSA
jgi:hypothetical protein